MLRDGLILYVNKKMHNIWYILITFLARNRVAIYYINVTQSNKQTFKSTSRAVRKYVFS